LIERRVARPLRFSVCNELFQSLPFEAACSTIREIGYTGIEIAPFTLKADPSALSREERAFIRRSMLNNQLEFVGLHWLLVSPPGLHATTRNRDVRQRTWKFIGDLIDLCADLKRSEDAPAVMVLGSPKQRSTESGTSPPEALKVLTEELASIAPHAARQNVQLLLEPLSRDQTDVVNTIQEAVRVIDEVNSHAVQTMFDVHNAMGETRPHLDLVHQFFRHIRHVHVNEEDGREPGTGSYDFPAILSLLTELHYSGWVSLEVFDLSRESRVVAAGALRYLKEISLHQTETRTL
jgi:D-psicose/D-tagatose/L-ribulose 3-epimerase